jgi:hypothetical protein
MHPQSQDVEYNFNFDISITPGVSDYTISYFLFTENETLAQLIAEQKAEAIIHVESAGGFFRTAFKADHTRERGEIRINADDLNGRVEVRSFICAKGDISDYRNEKQHTDYGDMEFRVRDGDYLAIGPSLEFIAEKEHDPLRKLSSFIKIVEGPGGLDQPATIEYAGQKVFIRIPKKLHEQYWELSKLTGYSATVSSLIIFPALIHLITEMRVKDCEFSETTWFLGIKERFQKLGVEWEQTTKSSFELAQLFLELPIKRVAAEIGVAKERNN